MQQMATPATSGFLATAYSSSAHFIVLSLAVLLLAVNYVKANRLDEARGTTSTSKFKNKNEIEVKRKKSDKNKRDFAKTRKPATASQYEVLDSLQTAAFVQEQACRVSDYMSHPATSELVEKVCEMKTAEQWATGTT